MTAFNIHITGVGGQGIGLLSQALLKGIDRAGIPAIAVDTHGLAQRGGVVVSRIRCGDRIHSPLILKHSADLVLGMEVHEALRSLGTALKKKGTLVYMDVCWQPLPVRLGEQNAVTPEQIESVCKEAGIRSVRVDGKDLVDARMQNMALLGIVAGKNLVPGVSKEDWQGALEDLLTGPMLEINQTVFNSYAAKAAI